jgi:hypothetical protein
MTKKFIMSSSDEETNQGGNSRHHNSNAYGSTTDESVGPSLSSYLWMPSNTSTEHSTRESINNIPPHVVKDTTSSSSSEMEPLVVNGSDNLNGTTSYQNGNSNSSSDDVVKHQDKTKRMINVLTTMSMILIALVGGSWAYYATKHRNQHTDLPVLHYDIIDAVHRSTDRTSKILPFSKLDPVIDLGLYNFIRPNVSSPRSSLRYGQYYQSQRHTNKNFPTNAWYQNLIMYDNATCNETKPGWEYRVYTIPYIVDVTGPVPGVRLHGNQIGASSNVIQLNMIAEYGLTIGRGINPFANLDIVLDGLGEDSNDDTFSYTTTAPMTASTTSTGNSSNTTTDPMTASTTSTDSTSDPCDTSIPSSQYQFTIHQATPLSVTLEWVSCLTI